MELRSQKFFFLFLRKWEKCLRRKNPYSFLFQTFYSGELCTVDMEREMKKTKEREEEAIASQIQASLTPARSLSPIPSSLSLSPRHCDTQEDITSRKDMHEERETQQKFPLSFFTFRKQKPLCTSERASEHGNGGRQVERHHNIFRL